MQRRTFLKSGAVLTAVAATGDITFCSCTMISGTSKMPSAPQNSFIVGEGNLIIDVEKHNLLKNTGDAVKISITNNNKELKLAIAKTAENEFVVIENKCSHGGRELEFDFEKSRFQCVSFGHSKFSFDGKVIGGPAPAPLKMYNYTFENNIIIVKLS